MSSHKNRNRILFLLMLMMFSGWVISGQIAKTTAGPTDAEMQSLLKERLHPKADTGIVVGLLDSRGPRITAAGKGGPAGVPPLDGDTVFEIGSVTKVFTTAVLAVMVESKEVSLLDPVAKFLPPTVRVPSKNGKEIKLIDLATQTSGLPTVPANMRPKDFANPYADYTVQQMYAFLSGYELTRDIGEKYEYSNLGLGLLGHVLSLKAGLSYETLVAERILKPLKMSDTAVILRPELGARLAIGHDKSGRPVSNWDIPTLAGAGALRSTVKDMLKFLEANLAVNGPLSPAIRMTHAPRKSLGIDEWSIGLGWHLRSAHGAEIIWHNGQTGGYHAFIGFDQKTGIGVVVLHNAAADIDDIGFHLIDARFPLTKPQAPPKPRTEIAVDPNLLGAYVGEYQLSPDFSISVTRDGGRLFVQATEQEKIQAFPESETEFFLKVTDAQISFIKDESGRITHLVLHQNGRDIQGKKIK